MWNDLMYCHQKGKRFVGCLISLLSLVQGQSSGRRHSLLGLGCGAQGNPGKLEKTMMLEF